MLFERGHQGQYTWGILQQSGSVGKMVLGGGRIFVDDDRRFFRVSGKRLVCQAFYSVDSPKGSSRLTLAGV